ncbi:hypothetical protein D9M69_714570 [compost metagenome]
MIARRNGGIGDIGVDQMPQILRPGLNVQILILVDPLDTDGFVGRCRRQELHDADRATRAAPGLVELGLLVALRD